jgi:glycosyltransferase involved in cell wall biosynthesis
MNKPLVSIITPTIGTKYLQKCVDSVNKQTYNNVQHLIVIDGKEHRKKAEQQIYHDADVLVLPYNTGHDQYNGHRIYGASTFFIKGDYVIFLDEDNWIEPNHIESLVETIKENDRWAYSLRKIVDSEGNYVCNDDCESLGNWESVLNDYFVDVNCYMLRKDAALNFAPGWYRRARNVREQPEVDRLLSQWLRQNNFKANCTGEYSVNYRVGGREDSVTAEFFLKGNSVLGQRMNGEYPWRKI